MRILSISGNNYTINCKRPFVDNQISKAQLQKALDFAFDMVYGEGHHRSNRTGGTTVRPKGEKFCNTFQGKLAEIVIHDHFENIGIEVSELDFGIYGKGEWDDCDLIANGKKINIKSAAAFSNLLLLETKDWDARGRYVPDLISGKETIYDYFIFVRFKPDIKSIFSTKGVFSSNLDLEKETVEQIILGITWFFDVGGCINNESLTKIVEAGCIIPQGAYLNGTTRMDASNYYAQTGDMANIEALIVKLHKFKNDTAK